MATRYEKQKPKKLERLHFKVEEGVAVESEEFLHQFLGLLIENNRDPQQLVFSGMDGTLFKKNKKMAPVKGVYAMNQVGWEKTFTDAIHMNSPAVYAERHEKQGVPAIGLFDKNLLMEAYGHQSQEHAPNLAEIDPEKELGKLSLRGEQVGFYQSEGGADVESLDNWIPDTDDTRFVETTLPEFVEEPDDFTDVELGDPLADLSRDTPVFEGVVHVNYPDVPISEALVGIVYIEKVPVNYVGPRNRAGF